MNPTVTDDVTDGPLHGAIGRISVHRSSGYELDVKPCRRKWIGRFGLRTENPAVGGSIPPLPTILSAI
jgi:hypothetical protein